MLELHYDQKEEKEELFQMWQEIFQDPAAFADYYFNEVYSKNQVLTAHNDGKLVGMIHLNPYLFKMNQDRVLLHYIVGVATDLTYRRQGIMRSMLIKVLGDLSEAGEPFTYLMPAKEAYYTPFQFAFIYDRYLWKNASIRERKYPEIIYETEPFAPCNAKSFYQFCWSYWDEKFQTAPIRSAVYLERYGKELASQNGRIQIIHKKGKIKGYFAFIVEKKKVYVEELITTEPVEQVIDWIRSYFRGYEMEFKLDWFHNFGVAEPSIMARILRLDKLIPFIKGIRENTINLEIKDPLLPCNDGIFCWKLDRFGSAFSRTSQPPQITISIEEFTQRIFGYRQLITTCHHPFFEDIIPISRLYISETV